MSYSIARTGFPSVLALALLLCGSTNDALAQFASNIRLTNPIGRTVLELRNGTQPANPRLLFTATITAGPTGGTTSLLLQQALLQDIFNPAQPAAGWTTVRSSATAFSLGGGCGRNNLIDFPYINNNRPEILRITGTTHQVITLGIAGNDQYDSIDCAVQGNGVVLYMLTNRTRSRLEFRREQGGLLQLVRDDFGNVITPFAGGIRPSISRFRPRGLPLVSPSPVASTEGNEGAKGGPDPLERWVIAQLHVYSPVSTTNGEARTFRLSDVLPLTTAGSCVLSTFVAPTAFSFPRDTAVVDGLALGATRNSNVLWGDYFFVDNGGCTKTAPPESFGAAGPFSLFTWTGVAANQVSGNAADGGSGIRIPHTTLILPNNVLVNEGNLRTTQPSPFAGRGGPVGACPLDGSEIDAGQVLVGVGPSAAQVQHSTISANLVESHGHSSFEDPQDTVANCN